jgi:hypothetical protein
LQTAPRIASAPKGRRCLRNCGFFDPCWEMRRVPEPRYSIPPAIRAQAVAPGPILRMIPP